MKKSIFFLLIRFVLFPTMCTAQVAKTSVVEHFTNSNCSICAANNPSIRTTLQTYANTSIHLTFYPSSPYASCFFSMQNATENDVRTNYYGLYGGTPQLAANGAPVTRQNLGAALSTAATQTSNFSIKTRQTAFATDSVAVRVVIKKMATDATTSALIFAGVAEDTIVRTTGNGETKHYNVFRKGLTAMTGNSVALPTTIGDSLVLNYKYKIGTAWQRNRLNVVTILQNTNKTLIQGNKSPKITTITAVENIAPQAIQALSPNPATTALQISAEHSFTAIRLVNALGQTVLYVNKPSGSLDIQALPNGFYSAILQEKEQFFVQKIIISR